MLLKRLEELRQLSGNTQLSYLESIKSDFLKEVLLYTYDPHKKYKIDEGKLNRFYTGKVGTFTFCEDSFKIFKYTILDHLADIKSAKDEDIKDLCDYLENFDMPSQELMKQIILKDLRINMNIKKLQKVWADFCVEPQVQLAEAKGNRVDFKNGRYSRKFDGKRMYIMDDLPYSRSNNLCYINPVAHILDQVKELIKDIKFNIVLDGECLYFENGKENFQKGISLCQSEERKEGCDNICYVIFDTIGRTNFKTKQAGLKFEDEYNKIIEQFADFSKPTPCYSLIPTKMPNIFITRQDKDPSKLMKLRQEKGWEGLMYRNADVPYEYKRTNNLLKIKAMQDTELKLVSMEEGTGKYQGKLGAFLVEYKNSIVKVGSGFSDELREEYWNNKDKYIGQYVKVQYFEETKNQDGTDSLRFPVFLSFRNVQTNEEFLTF